MQCLVSGYDCIRAPPGEVSKLLLDPTGFHALMTNSSGDTWYLNFQSGSACKGLKTLRSYAAMILNCSVRESVGQTQQDVISSAFQVLRQSDCQSLKVKSWNLLRGTWRQQQRVHATCCWVPVSEIRRQRAVCEFCDSQSQMPLRCHMSALALGTRAGQIVQVVIESKEQE